MAHCTETLRSSKAIPGDFIPLMSWYGSPEVGRPARGHREVDVVAEAWRPRER